LVLQGTLHGPLLRQHHRMRLLLLLLWRLQLQL
jgi:hypothetical protein